MVKVSKQALRLVELTLRGEAANAKKKFPPICMGILHQPKRPTHVIQSGKTR